METFKIVAEVSYQNKEFYVLINRSCQKYFLRKLEDGSMIYPTMDEFKALFSKFNRTKVNYAMLKGFRERFNINPKIITKIGEKIILVSLSAAMVFSFASCTLMDDVIPVEETSQVASINNDTKSFYERMGYKFEKIAGCEEPYYIIRQSTDLSNGKKKIHIKDRAEFAKYAKTPLSPSYDEVIETLSKNDKVPDEYKKILLDGLRNMKEGLPDLDLTILNFNLNRLEIIKVTEEEMAEVTNKNFSGMFNCLTAKVYFIGDEDDTLNTYTLLHECLGHASTEAEIEGIPIDEYVDFGFGYELKELGVVISDYDYTVRFVKSERENKKDDSIYGLLGFGLEEGKADAIANIAIDGTMIGGPYEPADEMLRIILRTIDMDLTEFINNGGTAYLNRKMQEKGIDNSLQAITTIDIFDDIIQGKDDEFRITEGMPQIEQNMIEFIIDYAVDQIRSGKMTKKEVIAKFSDIISDSKLEIIHIYLDGIEDIDVSKLEEDVIDSLDRISVGDQATEFKQYR